MKRMAWAGTLALAALGLAPAACAATYGWSGRSHYDGYRDAYSIGFDRGYAEGMQQGRIDGHRYDSHRYSQDRRYRQGDFGYRREHGVRSRYIDGYRHGYEQAYRRAFAEELARHRRYRDRGDIGRFGDRDRGDGRWERDRH